MEPQPDLLGAAGFPRRASRHDSRTPTVDLTDGVKVAWPDGWVHVRASNTESLVRIIAEADDAGAGADLADWARDRLGPEG